MLLFQLSHLLEGMATDRAAVNLTNLFDDLPATALRLPADVVNNGIYGEADISKAVEVVAEEVQVGDILLVKPGNQVCVSVRVRRLGKACWACCLGW